jgi:hypothetical protein
MKLNRSKLRTLIKEELEKLDFIKKYSYGIDDIPEKTQAHEDIIGHT